MIKLHLILHFEQFSAIILLQKCFHRQLVRLATEAQLT